MKRFVQVGLALILVMASGVAAALGLGQIELKSGLGEPLLAEIPIISNDPGELRRLQARLAPPATFARVGLEPPDETVGNLQFASALDAQGNPVIRVTSVQPITQPLLTFLIEVDWGQGQLVREYSVLLASPRTVAAPLQPSIEAPTAAPSNAIVRPPPPAAQPATPPATPPARADVPRATSAAPAQPVPEAAVAPAPVAAPTPAPVASAPVAPAPVERREDRYGAVQRGETLSEIATSLDLDVSLQQAMIALLRANPDAFIKGNINLLKQGVVLQVPPRTAVQAVDAERASDLVRAQTRKWRQARAVVPQPAMAASASGPGNANAEGDASTGESTPAGASAGARLEIVPPDASDASEAGTQSGIAAGGEGDMQRQQLTATKETLAARTAELAEMKSRVAELEQIQAKQQKLIEMKDSELAAVQQRLAQVDDGANGAASDASVLPWILGGVGLLVLALLAAWLLRRRARASAADTSGFRAPTPRPSLADAFGPTSSQAEKKTTGGRGTASGSAQGGEQARAGSPDAKPKEAPGEAGQPSNPPAPEGQVPAWRAQGKLEPATLASMQSDGSSVDPGVPERLQLARAYIDLGDRDSARQVLEEVSASGDADARGLASRMLRELR